MLQNRFLKENWDILSAIIYYLGIIIIAFSLFFNKYFLEKYFVADHLIEYPNSLYVVIIQITAFIIGFLFILFHVFNARIKDYLKKLKHTPDFVYVISLFLIFIIITLIIAFWQNHAVGELFSKISLAGYLTVAVLSFINFLLLKNKRGISFYEKEKNFWSIFSISFLLLAILNYFDLHQKFQNWFLSITDLPVNSITAEIHALIPFAIIVIAFFSFIFFFHKLKEHKTMLPFFYIGIIIAVIAISIDMVLAPGAQIYIRESLEMLMPFFFIAASLIAVFDSL